MKWSPTEGTRSPLTSVGGLCFFIKVVFTIKNIQPDKPFLNIEQQIQLLKNRGLIISNDEIAKKMLNTIGYYPLINGYSKYYMDDDDSYFPGTQIEHIYAQYTIDKSFQRIVFNRKIDCEDRLKTILGGIVAEHYGVIEKDTDGSTSYLNIQNFQRMSFSRIVLENIFKKTQETTHHPTNYYRENKNHIPPWIAFRNIDFWESISLYAILLPSVKQQATKMLLSKDLAIREQSKMNLIRNTFDLLRLFRNQIAHGSVLYTFKSKKYIPKLAIKQYFGEDILLQDQYVSADGLTDILGLFLALIVFNPNFNDSKQMVNEIIALEKTYIETDYEIDKKVYKDFIQQAGIPMEYTSLLTKALNKYLG